MTSWPPLAPLLLVAPKGAIWPTLGNPALEDFQLILYLRRRWKIRHFVNLNRQNLIFFSNFLTFIKNPHSVLTCPDFCHFLLFPDFSRPCGNCDISYLPNVALKVSAIEIREYSTPQKKWSQMKYLETEICLYEASYDLLVADDQDTDKLERLLNYSCM